MNEDIPEKIEEVDKRRNVQLYRVLAQLIFAVEGEYDADAEQNLIAAIDHLSLMHMPVRNRNPDYLVIAIEPPESGMSVSRVEIDDNRMA